MTAGDEASAWTEHQHNDGRRYYYNRITKASSWEKPESLKTQDEKANTTSWKEYKAADGRDYFYNPVTKQSVWEMPLELKRIRGLTKEDESEDEGDKEKEEEEEKEEAPEYASHEDRRAAFRGLLEEKAIKSSAKWEDVLKVISDDSRMNALEKAGERKQVFGEYIQWKKKRDQDEHREKKKRARDDWIDAVKAWPELKPDSRYKDAAIEFYEEEWFKLIEEEDRCDLFQDFMDEHEKKAKEERRKARKEYVDKVKKLYDANEEISVLSRWRAVQDLLKEDESFSWLSQLEALTSWEEWVTESGKKELETRSKAKYREERKLRDGFRELLNELQTKDEIKLETKWNKVVPEIQSDSRYNSMIGVPGSTPHDIFDDFLVELQERYKDDRAKIKKWAKAKGLVITSNSTYEWFHDQMKDQEGYLTVPEEHRTLLLDSLVTKAKEQDEEAEKAAKKNRKKFVELLQRTRDVTAATTYDGAAKSLGGNPAWEAVDDQTRRQCFDIFVDQLKKMQSDARKEEKAAEEKRKEKSSRKQTREPSPEPARKAVKKSRRDEEEEEPEPDRKKQKKDKDKRR